MQAAVQACAMQPHPAMEQHVQHRTTEHCTACQCTVCGVLAHSSTLQQYQGDMAAAVDKHSHGDPARCPHQAWSALTVQSAAGH